MVKKEGDQRIGQLMESKNRSDKAKGGRSKVRCTGQKVNKSVCSVIQQQYEVRVKYTSGQVR